MKMSSRLVATKDAMASPMVDIMGRKITESVSRTQAEIKEPQQHSNTITRVTPQPAQGLWMIRSYSGREVVKKQVRLDAAIRMKLGAVAGGCVIIFLLLAGAVVSHTGITRLDQPIADGLHTAATPPLTLLIRAITLLGSEGVWILTLSTSLFFFVRRKWLSGGILLFALLGEEALNFALKGYFARPRPVFLEPLSIAGFYSFPSGHSMGSAVVYGLLGYLLVRQTTNTRLRAAVVIGVVTLVMLIGFSRMYLGVHFFTDVLAGFAAGGAWLMVCIVIVETIQQRQVNPATV